MTGSPAPQTVVLLHGLYLSAPSLIPLQRRLGRCGFRALRFSYPSVRGSVKENAARLQHFLEGIDADVVHLVGHSLGGLVIRQWLHDFPGRRPGRVVTLGTPHRGSHVARRIGRLWAGRTLLGRSLAPGLRGDMPPWDGARKLGVIAGTRGVGVGWLVPGLARPNDGTVAVEETRVAAMTDYIELPVTHTCLLFSARTAAQVCTFLSTGRFARG